MEGKGIADDLKEGKLSYPILLFFIISQNESQRFRLQQIINRKRGTLDDLNEVKQILDSGKYN